MDFPAKLFLFRDDAIFVIFEDPLHFFITLRAINRLEQATFGKGQPATDLVVTFGNPVADHAGDAFARRWMPLQVRNEWAFAEIGADLIVAAQAKVTHRTGCREVQEIIDGHVDRA